MMNSICGDDRLIRELEDENARLRSCLSDDAENAKLRELLSEIADNYFRACEMCDGGSPRSEYCMRGDCGIRTLYDRIRGLGIEEER